MHTRILDFNAELPEITYWDSNFIINFCVDGARYYKPCSKFVKRLEKANITSIVSNLALDEVWYALIRANLFKDFDKEWIDKLRENPNVIKKYIPTLKRATMDLSLLQNVIFAETTREMTLQALNLIIKNIVTTDVDFIRAKGINIYTCNPKAFK